MPTQFKERPVIFNAPMVRTILEGRKTQTRRAVKLPLMSLSDGFKRRVFLEADIPLVNRLIAERHRDPMRVPVCIYGKPGDRLWVRETHSIQSVDSRSASVSYRERMPAGKTLADTDGGLDVIDLSMEELIQADRMCDPERWRPSIHMPRWASRITLEITDVRVQRLQDISAEDAVAEDVSPRIPFGAGEITPDMRRIGFKYLWNSINGEGAWNKNEWVWALTFRRLE